jgi:N-acetylneuraminate lyase
VQSIVDAIGEVSEAAPDLPVYYYHIPRLTGVGIRMYELLHAADTQLPRLAGIKYSSFEFDDLLRCVHHRNRHYNILFGSDEMLLSGLVMGVDGAVGSTFNFFAPLYNAVIDAFGRSDINEARQRQLEVTTLVHEILKHGGHDALKAAMSIVGEPCGPPRFPFRPLNAEGHEALAQALTVQPN